VTELEQPADAPDGTAQAVDRIAAATAAVAAVAELPLSDHAERYQQLHAALQAELGGIAGA
jgi:hypothetical protein